MQQNPTNQPTNQSKRKEIYIVSTQAVNKATLNYQKIVNFMYQNIFLNAAKETLK